MVKSNLISNAFPPFFYPTDDEPEDPTDDEPEDPSEDPPADVMYMFN